jgi:hypothetical protein
MKYFIFFVITVILSSCSGDKRLEKYYQIVDSADNLKYFIKDVNTFTLTKEIVSFEQLQNQKNILKRHIELDLQRKFLPKYKIEIYREEKLIGTLLINNSKDYPFVNFQNENFGFGFKLTYGIGMSL